MTDLAVIWGVGGLIAALWVARNLARAQMTGVIVRETWGDVAIDVACVVGALLLGPVALVVLVTAQGIAWQRTAR